MSVEQMARVWNLDLAPNKRLVLLAYADHADDEGDSVFPSLAKIAYKTGYSRDQVRRISKELAADNLMTRVEDARHNRGVEYRLTLERGSKLPPFRPRGGGANDPSGVGAPMPPEPPVEPSVEPPNDSSSNDSESAAASAAPSNREVSKQTKQEGVRELMERVSAATDRGAVVHSPTERERKDFGFQYDQARKDGRDRDTRLLALDYMVAKAAGEIENEPKAWCGYRTALDRVIEGWKPKTPLKAVKNPEHERMVEENERLEAELLRGIA